MIPRIFQPVLRLHRNTVGRDFVVGDIHGAFDLLEAALEAVNFDPAVDRVLLPGDLVDRGRYSEAFLAFVGQPWVFTVRGNHEQMALDLFDADGNFEATPELIARMYRNGMQWWLYLSAQDRLKYLRLMERMPFAMEVDTARGTIGIIHADVPKGQTWSQFIANLEAFDDHTMQTCLWGRSRLESEVQDGVPGVGRVFVGHTPQWKGTRRYGNVYALDTGAVFGQTQQHPGGALTLANVLARTDVLTARQRPVNCLNVLDDLDVPKRGFSMGPGYINWSSCALVPGSRPTRSSL
jgi:serine/threonine protein phosphatase 1